MLVFEDRDTALNAFLAVFKVGNANIQISKRHNKLSAQAPAARLGKA